MYPKNLKESTCSIFWLFMVRLTLGFTFILLEEKNIHLDLLTFNVSLLALSQAIMTVRSVFA